MTNSNGEYTFKIINCSIYLFCAIFASILNLLLITSWILFGGKKNYSNFLFISNTISDFIIGGVVCPFYFLEELEESKMSKFLICFVDTVDYGVILISYSSLILLSYHRLRLLAKPFEEKAELNRYRTILITSMWIISFFFGFSKNYTRYYVITSYYGQSLFVLLANIIGFYIPVLIILILNFLMIKKFIIKIKKNNLNKTNFDNEKKAIACTISTNFILLISQGLWFICYPFEAFKYEFPLIQHEIHTAISYSFCVFNPLVVFLFNKKLNKIFSFLNSLLQSYKSNLEVTIEARI